MIKIFQNKLMTVKIIYRYLHKKGFYRKNMVLALLLIIATIKSAFVVGRYDIWYDEAVTGLISRSDFFVFIKNLYIDGFLPLYDIVVKIFGLVIGYGDVSLRVPAVIFYIVSLYFLYLLLRKLTNKKYALIGVLLGVINPFLSLYAIEARGYTLYGAIFVVLLYLLFLKKYNKLFWLCMLFPFSHFFASFYLGILILYLYVGRKCNLKKALSGLNKVRLAGLFVMAVYVCLVLVSYYYYATRVVAKGNSSGFAWISPINLGHIFLSFHTFFTGVFPKVIGTPTPLDYRFYPSKLSSFLLFIIFYATSIKPTYLVIKKKLSSGYLFLHLLYLLPIVVASFLGKLFDLHFYLERYFFPGVFIIFVILCWNIFVIEEKDSTISHTRYLKFIKKYLGIAVVLLAFIHFINVKFPYSSRDFTLTLRDMLVDKESCMVVSDKFSYLVGKYYLNGDRPLYYFNLVNLGEPVSNYPSWNILHLDTINDLTSVTCEKDAIYFATANTEGF